MKKISVVLFCLLLASTSKAQVDLSSGIAFPSNNSSTFENPAALSAYSGSIMSDLAGLHSDDINEPGAQLSVVRQSTLGLGVGLTKNEDGGGVLAGGGFGYNFDGFQFGLNAFYDADQRDAQLNLGLRQDIKRKFAFAVVFYDLLDFEREWELGMGSKLSRNFRTELDLKFRHKKTSLTIDQTLATLSGVLTAPKTFEFLLGYRMLLVPEIKEAQDGLIAGLLFWFGHRFSLYGTYQDENAKYILGAKYIF